jgi:hypothetical protein
VLHQIGHHDRRQAQRQLVDREHIGPAHQRPPNSDHLLLTTGQRARAPMPQLGQPGQDRVHRPRVALPVTPPTEPQVVLDREVAEHLPALRHVREPPAHGDRARRGLEDAGERVDQSGLTGAVRSD